MIVEFPSLFMTPFLTSREGVRFRASKWMNYFGWDARSTVIQRDSMRGGGFFFITFDVKRLRDPLIGSAHSKGTVDFVHFS